MYVIPVESQILYCEPIYIESSTTSLPEVKRVIMYYGDDVAYEETLADCLDTLFGEGSGKPLRTPFPLEAAREQLEALLNPEPEEPNLGPAEDATTEPSVEPGEDVVIPDDLPAVEPGKVYTLEEIAEMLETIAKYLETMKE